MLRLYLRPSKNARYAVFRSQGIQFERRRHLATVVNLDDLPLPRAEQERVIRAIGQGKNVKVNAVAGSGKTTTILQVAKAFPNRKILALLYNRQLKNDMQQRLQRLNLTKIHVDTYHGFGYSVYNAQDCKMDHGLQRVVSENIKPENLVDFDLLCLDELQDTTPIIYGFIRKIIQDNKLSRNMQYLVVGDPRQEIYTHNQADKRFLTMAESAFGTSRPWKSVKHNTSYRATEPQVGFINKQLLHNSETHLKAEKGGEKPRYLICNPYSDAPLNELRKYLCSLDPSKILILAPSIRSKNSPVQILANKVAPNILCHIPMSDTEALTPGLSEGKLVFCSYHQAKGIEREAVIMFGFDASYYDVKNRAKMKNVVSNAQYVAVTRSSQYLSLIHDASRDYLPFLKPGTLHKYCDMLVDQAPKPSEHKKPKDRQNEITYFPVTSLTRHVPLVVISKCFDGFFTLEQNQPPAKSRINPPTTITLAGGFQEAVADITGTAIPAIYEYRSRGTCTLLKKVQKKVRSYCTGQRKSKHAFQYLEASLREKLLRMDPSKMTLSDFLFVANAANCDMSGYINKLTQIKEYNWLEEKHVKSAIAILENHISKNAMYDHPLRRRFRLPGSMNSIDVGGEADVIDRETLWELKWTDSLRPEYILQLVCYAALDSHKNPGRVYKLLHIPTGQIVAVKPIKDGFRKMLEELVKAKTEGKHGLDLTDEEFKEQLKNGFRGFVGGSNIPTWLTTGIP